MDRHQVPMDGGLVAGVNQMSRAAVADASHDLNNWLGVILGNVTLLSSSVGDDPIAATRLDAIGHAAQVAADIIRVLNDPSGPAHHDEHNQRGPVRSSPGSTEGTERIVLVVDDESAILVLARRVLQAEGITVVEANGGAAALSALATLPRVDVVLLDLTMPGPGPSAVIREVRRVDPGTGIVVMSGHDRRTMEGEVPDHADLGFLQKPFDIDELVATVVAAMPERTEAAQPAGRPRPGEPSYPAGPSKLGEPTCTP